MTRRSDRETPFLVRLPPRIHAELHRRTEVARRKGSRLSMNDQVVAALERYLSFEQGTPQSQLLAAAQEDIAELEQALQRFLGDAAGVEKRLRAAGQALKRLKQTR